MARRLTCADEIRLGWKTIEECHAHHMETGQTFFILLFGMMAAAILWYAFVSPDKFVGSPTERERLVKSRRWVALFAIIPLGLMAIVVWAALTHGAPP